jgi:hypothetical protein
VALRLYMDQDSLNDAVVNALRAAGIDVVTAEESGRQRAPDDEQLSFSTASGRVIYTANRGDFARIHKAWMEEGRAHAGIITRSHQAMKIGDQVRALRRICAAFDPATAVNLFEYLEAWVPPPDLTGRP